MANATCLSIADEPPAHLFKITTRRETDQVRIKREKDKVFFTVASSVGIGQAVIERAVKHWPKFVVIRLNLKGLENFKVTGKGVILEASVSSTDGKHQVLIREEDQKERYLKPDDPLWLNIQVLDADGQPTKRLPLKDGYFEIELPKPFFENNPISITIDWIDFYRN